jgi:alkyl sulfatase BDS1-like metallo-beta-lactamase superfamily hydrolase
MKAKIGYLLTALVFTGLGMLLAETSVGTLTRDAAQSIKSATLSTVASAVDVDVRTRVLIENPELINRIAEGGAFGGEMSLSAAQNMFGRVDEAIEDVRAKTVVEEVAPRSYLVRMPIVNAVFFETDDGIVVVDTGMAPAGPALLDAIRSVSDAPIHTIIYTHGHVDHAFGTWAFIEAGETPQIIAHEAIIPRWQRYMRTGGSMSKLMSQPLEQMPASEDDFVWPTRLIKDRLELEIGGETFVLQHHKGETDDQLYVWVPGRSVLASADYYQGFLPNAGNGKRAQRYVEEWAVAMREMASLQPQFVLPAHGAPLHDPALIQENFLVLAEALQYIVDNTLEGINSGLREDEVFAAASLPEHLAQHPSLNVQYVSVADISKMVMKRYTGWWNDMPSAWTPATVPAQGEAMIQMAGGVDSLIEYTRSYVNTETSSDLQLAAHFADWAFAARPDDPEVQALVIEVYRARIMDPASNTQEILAYLDQMTAARTRQLGQQ